MYPTLRDADECSGSVLQSFTYDGDANMTGDGQWTYVWDWENRLREARAASPVEGSRKLVFRYDHMNRRIRKQVSTYDAAAGAWRTTPESDTRFIYDGWNVVLKLDALDDNAVIRKYTWGLDLSGTRQGAGGIGGLLGIHDESSSDDFLVFSDANGNVGQFVDWPASIGQSSPVIAGKYEYDAYGNALISSGTYAATNPFRFSTKYCDAELDAASTTDDVYYYGYRYYRPEIGRWVSRDPMEQATQHNLLEFLRDSPINSVDPFGLYAFKCRSSCYQYCGAFWAYCLSCDGQHDGNPGKQGGDACTRTLRTCLSKCAAGSDGAYVPQNPVSIDGPCKLNPPDPGGNLSLRRSGCSEGPVAPDWVDTFLRSIGVHVPFSEALGALETVDPAVRNKLCADVGNYIKESGAPEDWSDSELIYRWMLCKRIGGEPGQNPPPDYWKCQRIR
ncbi:MAG: hypothetical protein DCC65_09915 [Planctomycetota bacterium]|nr:MAG: hypothetical protein DCC65_09915 [Planctomycetota bacterium]